jgi:hypothetical protein
MPRWNLRSAMRMGMLGLALLGPTACDDAPAPAVAPDAAVAADAGTSGSGGTGGGAGAGTIGDAAGDAVIDAPAAGDAANGGDTSGAGGTPGAGGAVGSTNKLDLVFMIDNSATMQQEQQAITAAFPAFINALAARPGGLPDLRIGIISSNVGAGPTQVSAECPPGGDRGRFQVRPMCGLEAGKGSFLSVDAAGVANFAGGAAFLPSVFQCMATLGTRGCGYEHQLLSLYLSLDGKTNPENMGFLRDDAVLGVVMVSDEDDCSGTPSASFYGDAVPGQSGSLRCALLGHTCSGNPVPAMPFATALSHCQPYQRGPGEENTRLIDVQFFVDHLKKDVKRGRSDRIFVATIIGWSDDPNAQYVLRQTNAAVGPVLDYGPICESPSTGTATPGLRLHAFAKAFENHAVHPICAADLSAPMIDIGNKLSAMLGKP